VLTQHSPERFTGCMSLTSLETSPSTACAKRKQRLGEAERYICYSCLVAISIYGIQLYDFLHLKQTCNGIESMTYPRELARRLYNKRLDYDMIAYLCI
jgi:hypothetical protein